MPPRYPKEFRDDVVKIALDRGPEVTLAQIAKDFGHEVRVLVLPAAAIDQLADSNPLRPRSGADDQLFHATFLFEKVTPGSFAKLALPARAGEQAVLLGQTVLLHCPLGYGTSKLNNTYFEKALGVTATTRNWRTVLALRDLAAGR